MNILVNSLEQSCILFPLAMSMFFSYTILKTVDLAVDGSFVLGGCVFAKLITTGISPVVSLLCSIIAGATVGILAATMQRHNRITPLISGILAVFMLTSINLQVMGRPNINIIEQNTILKQFQSIFNIHSFSLATKIFVVAQTIILGAFFYILLKTRLGLLYRAFGNNPSLLRMLGKTNEPYRLTGLMLSNGVVAYCGATTTQINGFADINMGLGLALVGIGTVIIGQHLARYFSNKDNPDFLLQICCCFIGVFIYFLVTNITICCGINPTNIKLLVGGLLAVFLFSTNKKQVQEALYGQ